MKIPWRGAGVLNEIIFATNHYVRYPETHDETLGNLDFMSYLVVEIKKGK